MSYCRFSDDFSDVYVFHHVDGYFSIMCAHCKLKENPPSDDPMDPDRMEPMGLPHAGEEFICQTQQEVIEKLKELASLGYKVPEHAYSRLGWEMFLPLHPRPPPFPGIPQSPLLEGPEDVLSL